MTFDEIVSILRDSSNNDWLRFREEGACTYKDDLNLRIQRNNKNCFTPNNDKDFNSLFINGAVSKCEYIIYYGNSMIKKIKLFSIGCDSVIPCYKKGAEVPLIDANIARIVDENNQAHKYMKIAQYKIIEPLATIKAAYAEINK